MRLNENNKDKEKPLLIFNRDDVKSLEEGFAIVSSENGEFKVTYIPSNEKKIRRNILGDVKSRIEEVKLFYDVKSSLFYREVLNHRRNCSKWNSRPKQFCLECFGGGLSLAHMWFKSEILGEVMKNISSVFRAEKL